MDSHAVSGFSVPEKSFEQEVRDILERVAQWNMFYTNRAEAVADAQIALSSLLRTRVMGVIPSEQGPSYYKQHWLPKERQYTNKETGFNSAISTVKENVERLFQ